ncbi:OXA-63 family oxacillin-hydrolyzing class D beta-lactamase OXA-1102 [Brachyspira pulli]|uniref:OXA-63 family oxacillin-hydrolyzing class D beta-lactamase OXA-1102 n=1 Tax=Brachyspira pulli TaxID=310721 RepID=UPI001FA6D854|nr:OXA-63 family oxacillin-hydrolyzing class D beta-lactamase OXA-1102 [Brachyspira pulli]UNN26062.1 OXA-63 family oxacillin-hydrolyzing class D beta-lactamase OXA-1102 [Brachyspira pulli]
MYKKISILILIFVILISCKNTEKTSDETTLIDNIFTNSNTEGTLVIYDLNENKYIIHNKERAEQRFYPASTFKIYNSLIGLYEKAVKDVDEVFYKYNGEKVFLESWAKDSNLRYAIKNSQVPAYKELARRIGLEKMKENIEKLDFGNKNIGDCVDTFWLEGPLEISAMEQVKLLTKLAQNELPYPIEIQEAVSDITILEQTDNYTFHGKTGLADSDNMTTNPIGWFVGWLEENNNIYVFALNIDNVNSDDLEKRISIVKESLKSLNLLK